MSRGLTLLEVLGACVMLTGLMAAGLSLLTALTGTEEIRGAAAWERSARICFAEIQRTHDRRSGEPLPIEPVVVKDSGFRLYRSEHEYDEFRAAKSVLSVSSSGRTRILIGDVSSFVCELDEHRGILNVSLNGHCGRSVMRALRIGSDR